MRYLALIGIAICRFSFAQIANSPMSLNQSPTTFNFESVNVSPIQFNPLVKTVFFISHQSNFIGTDISQAGIGFAHQFNKNRIVGVYNQNGSPDLSNHSLNLAYSKYLNSDLLVGIGVIGGITTSESINHATGGYQIGGTYKLSNNAFFSLWHQSDHLATFQSIGYHVVNHHSLISANLVFQKDQPIAEVSAGMKIKENFTLSAILSNGPYWIGLSGSFKYRQFIVSSKLAYHNNQLGFRPSIFIHYVFQEQKSDDGIVRLDVVQKHKCSNRHRPTNYNASRRSRNQSNSFNSWFN